MKIISILKKTAFTFSVVTVLASGLVSCDKNETDAPNNYILSGTASGSQVFPAVASGAAATLTGTFNAGSNNFIYNIAWTGLSSASTKVEIYGPANPGANGELLYTIPITASGVTGSANGSIVIPQSKQNLFDGKLYYIISNATYPAGEIRAQITATAQ